MKTKAEYSSYNGLSRVALYWGIPLMGIVFTTCISLGIAVICTMLLGAGGILFGAVGIPILLYLKTICETDDQAARITALELWCHLSKRNAIYFGGAYTLSPIQYGRRKHVYKRFFEKSTIH